MEASVTAPLVVAEINSKPRTPVTAARIIHKVADYVAMPLLSDRAAAGDPAAVDEREIEDVVLLSAKVIRSAGTYTALRIRGDSMAPLIPDGALIAVNHERRDPRHLEGKIVVARVGEGVTVKWLRSQHGQLMLVPQNVAAHGVTLLADTDDIIGVVECMWVNLS